MVPKSIRKKNTIGRSRPSETGRWLLPGEHIVRDVIRAVQTSAEHIEVLPITGRNRFGSIRFGSGLFDNSSVRFGLVRKITFPGSTRFGLLFWMRSGSVRFGSVRFRVRFRPIPEFNGSVRFGSAGSVRLVRFGFLFLPAISSN